MINIHEFIFSFHSISESRCVSSVCSPHSSINTPESFVSKNIIASISHRSSRRSGEDTCRYKANVDTLLVQTGKILNTLSIDEKEIIQKPRIPDILRHCLPNSNIEIKDNPRIPDLKFELPKISGLNLEITTPSRKNQVTSLDTPGTCQIIKITPGLEQPMKYANSTSLKMKHRRMKKHQLRRLRQRFWAEFRKKRLRKQAKKQREFEAEIAAVKREGTDFDAEAFVKEKLNRAQRGGFMINILETAERGKIL